MFFPTKTKKKNVFCNARRRWNFFQIKRENGDKNWIPNSCCSTCAISLRSVYRGDFDYLFRFTSPTSWRDPQKHIDDCYFCLTDVKGYLLIWEDSIIYPNVSSVTQAAYNRKDSNISREILQQAKKKEQIILKNIKPWNMIWPETIQNYSIKRIEWFNKGSEFI